MYFSDLYGFRGSLPLRLWSGIQMSQGHEFGESILIPPSRIPRLTPLKPLSTVSSQWSTYKRAISGKSSLFLSTRPLEQHVFCKEPVVAYGTSSAFGCSSDLCGYFPRAISLEMLPGDLAWGSVLGKVRPCFCAVRGLDVPCLDLVMCGQVLRYRESLCSAAMYHWSYGDCWWGYPSQDPHHFSNMYTMQATKSSVVDPRVVLCGVGRHRVDGAVVSQWGPTLGLLGRVLCSV